MSIDIRSDSCRNIFEFKEQVSQVQQRGVQASKEILQALLDNVVEGNTTAVIHVVDLIPNRPQSFWVVPIWLFC